MPQVGSQFAQRLIGQQEATQTDGEGRWRAGAVTKDGARPSRPSSSQPRGTRASSQGPAEGPARPSAALTEKVRLGLQTAGLDPDEGEPYLLPLLRGHTDTDRLAGLSSELRRARIFATLRQLLLPSPEGHPLVLTVGNLHWIDPTSEVFFTALVEGIAGARCLVLTTYRPGYRPPWVEKSYATQLVLPPLSAQDSRQLLHAIPPTSTMPGSLGQLILTRAQGNPFFLEELV